MFINGLYVNMTNIYILNLLKYIHIYLINSAKDDHIILEQTGRDPERAPLASQVLEAFPLVSS